MAAHPKWKRKDGILYKWENGHWKRVTPIGGKAEPVDPGLRVKLTRTRYTKKGILKEPLHFQLPPLDEFGWDVTYNWIDYDTVNGDQYSRAGGSQLRTLTITSAALDWQPPWASTRTGRRERWWNDNDKYGMGTHPERVAHRLDKLVAQGTPMMLIVRNPLLYDRPDFRHHVTLRSAHIYEKAGEPDARYFELQFTEYRVPKIQRRQYGDRHELPATVEINRHGVATEVRTGGEKNGRGDRHKIGSAKRPATFRMLAKHFYGSPAKWYLIKSKNGTARPSGNFWNLHGDAPLTKLFDHRKRKNQPVRLVIPRLDFTAPTGGVTPTKPKSKGKKKRRTGSNG